MTPPHRSTTKRNRPILFLILIAGLILSLPACALPDILRTFEPSQSEYNLQNTYPVDRVLKSFYDELDGSNLLGSAISPLLEIDGSLCQYTINALVCFDPRATGVARFRLEPLGLLMDIQETPTEGDQMPNFSRVDGYIIYPDILPLYHHFYGELYAGHPLTNAFFNPARKRIEQYFENLGFYATIDGSAPGTGLIEYGQAICQNECPAILENTIPPSSLSRNDPMTDIVVAVEFLGGSSLFGQRLTPLQTAADGNLEIVYENAVFFAPLEHPRQIQLRELPAILGLPQMAPVSQIYDQEDNMSFYATEGELGFHIPLVFLDFIQEHGGISLSGIPLAETAHYEGSSLPRQCYQFICLEYDKAAPENKRVTMVDLGRQYLKTRPDLKPFSLVGGLGSALQAADPQGKQLSFRASESSPQVRRSETQTIRVLVFDRRTYQPVSNVAASLVVTHPDGSQSQYILPPTNASGISQLEIEAMGEAPDGSLIPYEVCLLDVDAACKVEAYMIWGD